MMKNIDPAIQREFDNLGFNIVDNENLADLIIARTNRMKRKIWLLIGASIVALGLGVLLILQLLNSSPQGPTIQSTSVITSSPSKDVSPLPLYARVDIDSSKSSTAQVDLLFDLKAGEIIEYVSQIPLTGQGIVGELLVSLKGVDGKFALVQRYQIGSETHIQEFGVNRDGRYLFRLAFTEPNYKGQIRILVARGR